MNITKSTAAKLLNAAEMKLYEESRINAMRKLAASQLDRRILRTRELRNRAADKERHQNLAMRERTGTKHGDDGAANLRSAQKLALLTDILHRFEGQIDIARNAEAAGKLPEDAPVRRVTRKVAKTRVTAPGHDFTGARMRSRKKDAEEAADIMRSRAANRTQRVSAQVSQPAAM